jgi:hypothetical protein
MGSLLATRQVRERITNESYQPEVRISLLHRGRRLVAGLLCAGVVALASGQVIARDSGQWEGSDPSVTEWYRSLMQPDNPTVSCCGESDAYWCDDIHVRDAKAYCRITDDRPDGPLGRPHREVGAEFEIPPNKLKWDKQNPTGHSIIFLSTSGNTYCFVQAGGV